MSIQIRPNKIVEIKESRETCLAQGVGEAKGQYDTQDTREVMFEVDGASVYLYMEMDGGQRNGR